MTGLCRAGVGAVWARVGLGQQEAQRQRRYSGSRVLDLFIKERARKIVTSFGPGSSPHSAESPQQQRAVPSEAMTSFKIGLISIATEEATELNLATTRT